MQILRYFTVLLVLSLAAHAQLVRAQSTAHTFRIFVRGVEAGIEEVTLLEVEGGWTLRGSGRFRAPLNLSMDYWEARYDKQWRPLELTANITENQKKWTVHTTFSGTSASTDVSQGDQTERRTHTVAADAIVLPNLIFGSYEALAVRLASAKVGMQLQGFIVPQDAVTITLSNVTDEVIEVPGRRFAAKRWSLQAGGATKLDMEVWIEGSTLLRIDIPAQMLSVVRDDIAGVSTRLVTMARPNDEQVSIPANGFSLAATVSKPANVMPSPSGQRVPRLPAVVLVSGSTVSDRDEIVAGVPIFAQLASALADAGYLVVRYDERGAGQSGGRSESATLEEFAIDARAVVAYLRKRRDVDPKRIALVGYSEGGWIAILAAAREQQITAVAAIATPGIRGADLVLEQQRRLLENGTMAPAAQEAAVQQQKQILDAVVTGKGWDVLPPDLRQRVDTPLYRSILMFDPAQPVARMRQPLLVVQPALDREVPPHHGEQLAQLGRARQRAKSTDVVQVEGVNHLLTRAATGGIDEYGVLSERSVSSEVITALTDWLNKSLAAPPTK